MILPRQGHRIVWLVRLLATVGLAMVIVTTGLVGWTLAKVRTDRERALAAEEPLNRASDELRQRVVESRTEIQAVLDETVALMKQNSVVRNLTNLIHTQLTSRPDPAVLESLTRLEAQASRLAVISGQADAWRASYSPVWEDLRTQRTMSKLRSLIAELRSGVETRDGRRRLADAIKYRRWKNAAGEEAAAQARAIIQDQGRQQGQDSASFKNQLAEFARLVELLGGEEQFDSLADLKDNKLKPVLDQLSHSLAMFGTNQYYAGVLTPQAVESFKTALYGDNYTNNDARQDIQPGGGGLFTLRRDALRLRREREKLKTELAGVFQEIEAANASFARSAQVRTSELTLQLERNLAASWRRMLIGGGGCSVLFLWLAWFISRGVNAQVAALEQARAEAEAGRQTTQKLMVEQQAAAGKLAAAHKELQASEHRQELIFNSISEGIQWIDLEGKVVFENPAAARLLGWEISDLLGQPAHATMHHTRADGSPHPQGECPIDGGLKTGELQHVTNDVFWRKDGSSFAVEYTSTPVRDENGGIKGVVVVFADVSERRRAEAELEKVHKELLDTSRKAGMAEVATGVLHNVGNVLNSVNVSSGLVAENLTKSRAANLFKIAAVLDEHAHDLGAFITTDPKGRQIPAYLGQLAKLVADEQANALKELGRLQKNIDHIKDIVAMQQNYAKVSGVSETVKVTDLIEDALALNVSSLTRHDVQLAREYAPHLPELTMEKHKVLQILVNLIRNAKHACDDSGSTDKRLAVRVTNGSNRVRVCVVDNGIGIPAENLTRIFNHGFTTKKDGHGFGLHSGALTARELGGSLTVQSDGPGKGATFTLELPVTPAAAPAPGTQPGSKHQAQSSDPDNQTDL